jgi:hypothetical protein
MDGASQHERFAERFVRSQDRIYAYVVTLLPNRADAEEVFQQTCLALWKKWGEFDPARVSATATSCSWPPFILPYVEQDPIYRVYHFEVRWDDTSAAYNPPTTTSAR